MMATGPHSEEGLRVQHCCGLWRRKLASVQELPWGP